MRKTATAFASDIFSMGEALSTQGTALQTLRAIVGADKVARHDAIVVQVGLICALALASAPPKGMGNPADHTKVAATFTDGKMPRYAEACVGLSVALKVKGFRSLDWEDAQLEGFAMADGMLSELRPKVKTKVEAKAAEERKAAKAKAREAEAKADAAKAAELKAAELAQEFDKGRAQGRAEVMTAETVAAAIRLGQFNAEGLALIADALKRAPVDAEARAVAPLALTA
jgi:hypothetical protein